MISADEEFENLKLATLDIKLDHPPLTPVAALPAEARALVSDGMAWWTSHREQSSDRFVFGRTSALAEYRTRKPRWFS
jgi:hypothetical protein